MPRLGDVPGVQVLSYTQQAQLILGAQPYKVDMLSFALAALGQLSTHVDTPPLLVLLCPAPVSLDSGQPERSRMASMLGCRFLTLVNAHL